VKAARFRLRDGAIGLLLFAPFSDWHEVFPGAACIVSLVDRLVHNAEVIAIDGDSYRLKEAKERAEQRARQRRAQSS